MQREPGPKFQAMPNIKNAPYRAHVPEDVTVSGWTLCLTPILAIESVRRYGGKPLAPDQWNALLREVRFTPRLAAALAAELWYRYPAPLTVDEWADLWEQLAIEHVLAVQYPRLR